MNDQGKQWFDDEYEALSLMISNSDKSHKEVACFLFPHLKAESAYARLKSCLNPDKDERLTFGQIIAAMKFCNRFEPLYYACDETLHSRPALRMPDEEEAAIVNVIKDASATMEKAMRQLERLQVRKNIKAV